MSIQSTPVPVHVYITHQPVQLNEYVLLYYSVVHSYQVPGVISYDISCRMYTSGAIFQFQSVAPKNKTKNPGLMSDLFFLFFRPLGTAAPRSVHPAITQTPQCSNCRNYRSQQPLLLCTRITTCQSVPKFKGPFLY